jgi:molecular chaperone IbpA
VQDKHRAARGLGISPPKGSPKRHAVGRRDGQDGAAGRDGIAGKIEQIHEAKICTPGALNKAKILAISSSRRPNGGAAVRPSGGPFYCMSLSGGYAMRQFDLAPLYRNTVGFDRLFSMLDQIGGTETTPSYPPYNIERTGENAYRISVAVAGFSQDDLSIEVKENALTIRGEKKGNVEQRADVLYQGIAARTFERRFQLADYVQVTGASLENGLLHVELVREIPEAKKPRQIAINGARAPQTIEARKAA